MTRKRKKPVKPAEAAPAEDVGIAEGMLEAASEAAREAEAAVEEVSGAPEEIQLAPAAALDSASRADVPIEELARMLEAEGVADAAPVVLEVVERVAVEPVPEPADEPAEEPAPAKGRKRKGRRANADLPVIEVDVPPVAAAEDDPVAEETAEAAVEADVVADEVVHTNGVHVDVEAVVDGAGIASVIAVDAVEATADATDATTDAPVDGDGDADGEGEQGATLPTSAVALDPVQLKYLVEALVFASDKPITVQRLRQLTRVSDVKRLEQALVDLEADYRERGLVLQQVSGGYQFRTRTQWAGWVQQLIAGRPVRLSRAQLETLAIVAYRQPITRPEIDEIRGVDSTATIKLLLDRSLIRDLGKKEEVGRPRLYGTTKEFLDFFSLSDLRELPTLREYSELTDESRRVMTDRLGALGVDAGDETDPDGADPIEATDEPDAPAPDDPDALVRSYLDDTDIAAAGDPSGDGDTTGVDAVTADASDVSTPDVPHDDADIAAATASDVATDVAADSTDNTLEALAARRLARAEREAAGSEMHVEHAEHAAPAESEGEVAADAEPVSEAHGEVVAEGSGSMAAAAHVDVAEGSGPSTADASAHATHVPDDVAVEHIQHGEHAGDAVVEAVPVIHTIPVTTSVILAEIDVPHGHEAEHDHEARGADHADRGPDHDDAVE